MKPISNDASNAENGQSTIPATGVKVNELPKSFHTCFCGFSLIGAYDYLGGQQGVSRMMLDHLETVHGVEK